MAHRWRKVGGLAPGQEIRERGSVLRPDSRWRAKMAVNGFGALITGVVACIFAITKFTSGAWIVLVVIPLLVINFLWISRQYQSVADRLRLPREAILKLNWQSAKRLHNHVVVLVDQLGRDLAGHDLAEEAVVHRFTSGQNSFLESRRMVTGPSFTSSTSMCSWK